MRTPRSVVAAGLTLSLALPGAAMAHRGVHHYDHFRYTSRNVPCHALEAGRTPKALTADQVTALKQACQTRDAAVKAANAKFKADTADARTAYQNTVKPLRAEIRAANKARRSACRADRHSQACADARSAYRTTLTNDRPKLRAALRTYTQAVRPAAKTRRASIAAAQKAFRASVKSALAPSTTQS